MMSITVTLNPKPWFISATIRLADDEANVALGLPYERYRV